jgi:hypothetical protein
VWVWFEFPTVDVARIEQIEQGTDNAEVEKQATCDVEANGQIHIGPSISTAFASFVVLKRVHWPNVKVSGGAKTTDA